MSTVIHDHKQQALSRLCQQYKERSTLPSLLKILVDPLQEIEDELEKLKRERWLETAEGLQLDYLGDIAGEERNNRCDVEFRMAIYTRIFINLGGATPEDIIKAINLTYKPRSISYSELYPAAFQIYLNSSYIDSNFRSLIKSIIPVGLRNFVITHSSEDNPFIFAECSSEISTLKIKENIEDDDSELAISTDTGLESFNVVTDTLLFPNEHVSFAEIIIAKTHFSVGEGDIFSLGEDVFLEIIPTLDDFKINGGSKLAEVIENG